MKKIAIILIVLSLFSAVRAAAFSDVDSSTRQGMAIEKLYEKGIVNGTGGGYFQPEASLTRSQFVKMVNKVFGYTFQGENKFLDVTADKWYYADVCIAAEAGYINGTGDGRFLPEDMVSREQACIILDNVLNMELIPYYTEPNDAVSSWARDSVIKAISNGLITLEEGGGLRATMPMTRGEACLMLEKCLVEDVGEIEKIDLGSIAAEELEIRMERVITAMETKVIPALSDEKSIQVAELVVLNMKSYLADNSHDYEQASKDTFKIYETIPKATRTVFKNTVQLYNKLDDLMLLYEFFYIAD